MRKQPLIFVLAAVIIVALGVITYGIYKSSQQNSTDNNQQDNAAKQAAIDEAKAFQPPEGMMCTQVMTPAVHRETGATHTFTSGCLPDGWERDDSAADLSPAADQTYNLPGTGPDDPSLKTDRRGETARPTSSRSDPESSTTEATDRTSSRDHLSAEERALRDAQSYRPGPDTRCTQVLTPATHKETGVKYTFPTGCIPEGWVRDDDRTPRFNQ